MYVCMYVCISYAFFLHYYFFILFKLFFFNYKKIIIIILTYVLKFMDSTLEIDRQISPIYNIKLLYSFVLFYNN